MASIDDSDIGRAQMLIRCQLCPNKVELFCRSCQVKLCSNCSGQHALTLSSRSHDILKYTIRNFHIPLMLCSIHSSHNNQCQFYCQDCTVPICVECLKSTDHKYHKFEDLEHVYNSKKETLLQETQILKEDIAPKYQRIIDEINDKMLEIKTENLDIKAEISARLQEWKHFVDIGIQILHAKADINKEKDLKTLGEILSRFKERFKSVNQAILENEESLQVPNENFLRYIPKLEEFQDVTTTLHLTNQIFTPSGQGDKNKQCARQFYSSSVKCLDYDPVVGLIPPTPEEGFAFVRRMLQSCTAEKDKINARNSGLAPQKSVASSVVDKDQLVTLLDSNWAASSKTTNEESLRFIKSQSVKAVIEDPTILPNLEPYELSMIHEMREQHDVKLSVEQRKGIITLEGLIEEVINARCKIQELLRNSVKEEWLYEEAKLVADTVQWSVLVKDRMTGIDRPQDYPKRQNMYLESAYKKKENTVRLKTMDGDIIVDLTTMKEYPADDPSQTNNVVRKEKATDLAISNVGLGLQRGMILSAVVADQSVKSWIYGDTKGDRDNTIKETAKFIKSQSTKAKIEDRNLLPNLKPNELDKIKNVSKQHDVKLSVEQHRGVITVVGLTEEVSNAKDKIHELLRHFQKERWLDEKAKLVADTVQWSVMVKDRMTGIDRLEAYPKRQNMYLESAYKKKENTVRLKAVDGDIIVDLTTMKEFPAYDPSQTDNVVRKEKATGNKIELPAYWTPMKDNENIKVVTLLPSSQEYLDIEKRFLDGVKMGIYNTGKVPNPANNPVGQFNKVKVLKIERIQNPSLYQQYAAKLDHIEKHVDQNTTKLVQDLWHGAAPAAIVSINYYGFNRSYCRDNGGEPWYGRGVYFASDASYSARNWLSAPDPSGKKKMYQARVITGHFCRGQKGMKYLPERITGVNYDCAVNDMKNPTEFVIFNDTQAYPEYCIEFTI